MSIKPIIIALRIAVTSRWPIITRSYRRDRRLKTDTFNLEPISLYRSGDCKRQRALMAAGRTAAFKRRHASAVTKSESGAQYPEISICLVTYNSENWIEDWFQALADCGYPHDKISLSIVDNASIDGTLNALEECLIRHDSFNLLKLHKSSHNLGFGRGQNIAMSHATSEHILVINPDAFLSPGSLQKAVKFLQDDEKDVCAWEFSQHPYEHPKYYDPVTLETSWNSHACVLFKKSAVDLVGGYDDALFMYGEDVDLSYKLRRAGFRLRYLPNSKVHHDSFIRHGNRSEQSPRIIAANLGLRRRYGKISDRIIGRFMVLRASMSSRESVKNTYGAAWDFYKENRAKFSPVKRKNIYYPFSGFNFDRRRPGSQIGINQTAGRLPKISVITRIHKKTDVLGDALLSVKNQTYPNVEHVIVFDKCDPYFISDQKVVQSAFATRSDAANAGAYAATGDYLLFLDYDDVLFADHLEGLLSVLMQNPHAVCAYALSWEAMTKNREAGGDQYLGLQNAMESQFSAEKLQTQNFFAIQSLLIKRSVFEKVGGFRKNLDVLEDWDLWKRLEEEGAFVAFPKLTSVFYTPSGLMARFKRALDLLP